MAEMTLSTAIREGAKLRPQAFGAFVVLVEGQFCTCAIGAGYEGLTSKLPPSGQIMSPQEAPDKMQILFEYDERCCPECRCSAHRSLENVVAHLNDDHRWTREAIADWLAEQGY